MNSLIGLALSIGTVALVAVVIRWLMGPEDRESKLPKLSAAVTEDSLRSGFASKGEPVPPKYQPTHDEIAFLAHRFAQINDADPDHLKDWFMAESILTEHGPGVLGHL